MNISGTAYYDLSCEQHKEGKVTNFNELCSNVNCFFCKGNLLKLLYDKGTKMFDDQHLF